LDLVFGAKKQKPTFFRLAFVQGKEIKRFVFYLSNTYANPMPKGKKAIFFI